MITKQYQTISYKKNLYQTNKQTILRLKLNSPFTTFHFRYFYGGIRPPSNSDNTTSYGY